MDIVFILSLILLALCVLGLSINMLIKKNGSFPKTEIGENPHMREHGIRCAKEEELALWNCPKDVEKGSGCASCHNPCDVSSQKDVVIKK